jgi:5-hydroxyisourate hydrolase
VSLSTHILDTSRGRPAGDVRVRLDVQREETWHQVADGRTNHDGRLAGWQTDQPGVYRLVFSTADHLGADAFYPEVVVAFRVADPREHYHVPLLISPFGYSTYRGS